MANVSLRAYEDSEDPDLPAQPRSLIRAFAVCLQNSELLSTVDVEYNNV